MSNSLKNSHFRNLAKCKTFPVTMSFIYMAKKKNGFLISGFTRSLALKQRLGASRKWPTLHINDQCLLFPYLSRFVFAKGKTDAFWLTTKD